MDGVRYVLSYPRFCCNAQDQSVRLHVVDICLSIYVQVLVDTEDTSRLIHFCAKGLVDQDGVRAKLLCVQFNGVLIDCGRVRHHGVAHDGIGPAILQ